jgi:hypothetical protein
LEHRNLNFSDVITVISSFRESTVKLHKSILIIVFLAFSQADGTFAGTNSGQTANTASADSLNNKDIVSVSTPVPSDTVYRLIKHIGKDSFIRLLNYKIAAAADFINERTPELRNPVNKMQLDLLSRQFDLGIDSVSFGDMKREDCFLKLYDHFFDDRDTLSIINEIVRSKMNADSLALPLMADKNIRTIIITYCQTLNLSDEPVLRMYAAVRSMYDTEEIYWLLSQYLRNGCGKDISQLTALRDSLYIQISNIMYYRDMPVEMDEDNIVDVARCLAYGLYAGNTTLNDGVPIIRILSTQLEDGGWSIYQGDKYRSNALSALFGLWSLLEIRDKCVKMK